MSTVSDAASLAMGYGWGRENEAAGEESAPSGNVMGFATAYAVAQHEINEAGGVGYCPPLQECWRLWQESGHATIYPARPATDRARGKSPGAL